MRVATHCKCAAWRGVVRWRLGFSNQPEIHFAFDVLPLPRGAQRGKQLVERRFVRGRELKPG